MADRGHDRGGGHEDGPDHGLVGEREQVLDRAAAAGDDDHVDVRIAVEQLHCVDNLSRGMHALHRGVLHGETDAGPATSSVLQHVALCRGVLSRHQADVARQERERPLALRGEEPLGREQLAATLEAGEQLALTDESNLAHGQRESASVGVERRLGVAHDLRALHQRGGQGVDHRAVAGDLDRDVGELVAQGQEDGVHAAATADLGHLALNPYGPESVDPLADCLSDLAHRRRMLGGGLQGHVGTVVVPTYDWGHDRSGYAEHPLAGRG